MKVTEDQKKGAHGTCPVVRVKANNEQGFTEINESDFDDAKHERFEPKVEKAADHGDAEKAPESAPVADAAKAPSKPAKAPK